MSSMRNAVARRPHRERAQPLERRRLGLLEKHKDYSLRAKDFNKKKSQLKALRAKAADRNEDEFYFGMMSRKGAGSRIMNGKRWTGTIEGDRGNRAMDIDTVRILKTQDIGYVRTMRQVLGKEVARLEEQVVLTRGLDRLDDDDEMDEDDDEDDDDDMPMPSRPKEARKIMFLDDEEEREATMLEKLEDEQDDEEDEDNGKAKGDNEEAEDEEFEREKSLRRLRRQLDNSKRKLQVLKNAEEALDVQRAKMAKTATSGGHTRKGRKIVTRTRKR